MGFAYSAKERKVYPLSSCDLLLHQHGESGDPPLDYGFTVKAGTSFKVNILIFFLLQTYFCFRQ